MKLRNKNGHLTAYGLRCGYRATAESHRGTVRLQASDHGKGFDVLTFAPDGRRIAWESFDTLTEARAAFAAAKQGIDYAGPPV